MAFQLRRLLFLLPFCFFFFLAPSAKSVFAAAISAPFIFITAHIILLFLFLVWAVRKIKEKIIYAAVNLFITALSFYRGRVFYFSLPANNQK